MSLSYSGPATLHISNRMLDVGVELRTDLTGGVYSWGGRFHTNHLPALQWPGRGGLLSLPNGVSAEVHFVTSDLDLEHGAVAVRLDGHGRAPYEAVGDVVTEPGPDGSTVYLTNEEC